MLKDSGPHVCVGHSVAASNGNSRSSGLTARHTDAVLYWAACASIPFGSGAIVSYLLDANFVSGHRNVEPRRLLSFTSSSWRVMGALGGGPFAARSPDGAAEAVNLAAASMPIDLGLKILLGTFPALLGSSPTFAWLMRLCYCVKFEPLRVACGTYLRCHHIWLSAFYRMLCCAEAGPRKGEP